MQEKSEKNAKMHIFCYFSYSRLGLFHKNVLPLHRVSKNAANLVIIFKISKFMAKNLYKRFELRKNGKVIKTYVTYGRAVQGYESLFNKGNVLPYDSFTIIDSQLNLVMLYA